jgi:hypothetical protein
MKIEEILQNAVQTFSEKRKQYGSTDQLASAMLKLAYPNGITPEKYNDVLVFIKITEKLIRISSSDIEEQSKSDAYGDIIGYGLLGLNKDLEANKKKIPEEEKISVKCKICNEMIEAAIPLSEYKSDGNYVHLECFQKYQSENKTNIIPTETINTVE